VTRPYLVLTVAVLLIKTVGAQEGPAPLALTGITIIDGTGAAPRPDMTVVINGDRITQIFPTGSQQLPPSVRVRDLRGHFLIPGLIDAHVHLTMPHFQNGVAARLLRGGVTTVRNMVGNCALLREKARQAAAGEIESPDIHYSSVAGGASMRADPRATTRGRRGGGPGVGAGCAHLIGNSFDAESIVTVSKEAGVTGMKLYADMPAAAARRLSDEAHRQGLTVWAHAALFPARPSDVVNAGVDVLSHAAYLSWETVDTLPSYRNRVSGAPFGSAKPTDPAVERVLRDMAARGAILDATLHLFRAQATRTEPSPNEDFQVPKSVLEAAAGFAYAVTRRARELGVSVSTGTDGQGAETEGSLPNLHVELELLVNEAGFSPLEAIQSATSIAARTMRLDSVLGTIAQGKQADLVVLRSDPTRSIGNTRDIAIVVKRGRVIEVK
jgi:imidazolonepropionase-like amidohydrolase